MPCTCQLPDHPRFQGDRPDQHPVLIEEIREEFPPSWIVSCRSCDRRWAVHAIPYGGIYGDFDWERLPPAASE